jgi:hypothetical protein
MRLSRHGIDRREAVESVRLLWLQPKAALRFFQMSLDLSVLPKQDANVLLISVLGHGNYIRAKLFGEFLLFFLCIWLFHHIMQNG